MTGKLEFIKPGLFTSVQDLGRTGFRNMAIPNGGSLDQLAAQRANLMLNNSSDSPVLECTQMGPVILFHGPCTVSFAGANTEIKLNNVIVKSSVLNIIADDLLDLRKIKMGNRLYIGIKNGFQYPQLFDSTSPVSGLSRKLRFQKGDLLNFEIVESSNTTNSVLKPIDYLNPSTIKCTPGPEYQLLSEEQLGQLFQEDFSILPTANRMAFPLVGQTNILKNELKIITSPVIPGIVQLTPAGQLVVLMRDAQTTGGYPRILVLTEQSINELAQLRGISKFRFEIL